jgi:fibronectin type 3 domain-containing protein
VRKWSIFAVFALFAILALLAACSDDDVIKAPKDVKASAVGSFVEVAYKKVDKAVEYKVYRKGPPPVTLLQGVAVGTEKESDEFKLVSTLNDTLFIDVNVDARYLQQYSYRVSAVDEKGKESALSSTVNTRCKTTAAPANLDVYTNAGSAALGITASWSSVANATSYKVYYSERKFSDKEVEEAEDLAAIFVKTTTSTSYTVRDNLSTAKYYYFRVTAISGCGESDFSDYDSASTGCLNPDVPAGLKAEALSEKAIKISWDAVEGAKEYFLYYETSPTNQPNNLLATLSSTSYTHNVSSATTVYYRVVARNDCGSGNSSVTVFATTDCKYGPDPVPSVSAVAASKTSIDVTWVDSEDKTVTAYQVFVSATGGNNTFLPVSEKIVGRENTKFTHTGLTAGTTRFYKVKAINKCGTSDLSSATGWDKTFVDCVEGQLPAPTGLATIMDGSQIRLSFSKHPNADSYEIYRTTKNPDNADATEDVFDGGLISTVKEVVFADGDARPNSTYYYAVKAVNSCQKSVYSAVISIKTECFTPSTPQNVNVTRLSATSAMFSWSNAAGADSYEVYRVTGVGTVPSLRNLTTHIEGNNVYVIETGLDSAQTYSYYVVAVNSCAKGTASTRATLSPKTCAVLTTPSGVSAAVMGDDKIAVQWATVQSAAGYNIYRSIVPSASSSERIASNVKGRLFEDKEVSKTQMYYYFVSAVDSCGKETSKSNNAGAVICATPGSVSYSSIEVDSTSTSIKLTWLPVSGAAKYVVKRYAPSTFEVENGLVSNSEAINYIVAAGDTVTTPTKTITGLTKGTRYWFKITSINFCGDTSTASSYRETRTIADKIGAVSGLAVSVPSEENITTRLDITWNQLPDAAYGYRLYRAASANGGLTFVANVNNTTGEAIRYQNNGLSSGTTYWYVVTALDEFGEEGTPSAVVSGKTRLITYSVPNAPIPNNDASYFSGSNIYPHFSYAGTITDYEIRYHSSNNTSWTNINGNNISNDAGNRLIYGNLSVSVSTSVSYYFQARVRNAIGWSMWSNNLVIDYCPKPGAPQLYQNPGHTGYMTNVIFSGVDDNYFEIQLSNNNGANWYHTSSYDDNAYYSYGGNGMFFFYNLPSGTYSFRLRNKNSCGGESNWAYTTTSVVVGGGENCPTAAPNNVNSAYFSTENNVNGAGFYFNSYLYPEFTEFEVMVNRNQGGFTTVQNSFNGEHYFFKKGSGGDDFVPAGQVYFELSDSPPASSGYTYQLAVRVKNSCGEWSDWSYSDIVTVPD